MLVRSDEAVNGRPYVARVLEMHGEKEATVMWFYRYARTRRPLARLRSGAGERLTVLLGGSADPRTR